MGKPTGFLEYQRQDNPAVPPLERIRNWKEFHALLPREQRKLQGARCMDCGVPFCQSGTTIEGLLSGCPLSNLIPDWNDMLFAGNLQQALGLLLQTNNFPEFTARVCPAPCEAACTCGLAGSPISIKENELDIIESGYASGGMFPRIPRVRTDKRVAIIGSGPAGLAAADQLNKRGHQVTVFERSDRIGGLLMYGIPNMKLEKAVVQRRVEKMQAEGVVFRTCVDVGNDCDAQDILRQFDAVVLACGASTPRDISVPGRESGGICFAVDYLAANTKALLAKAPLDLAVSAKGRDVLVIGGGDTGNDCVGTAIRQGAKSVLQLVRSAKRPTQRTDATPWPVWPRLAKVDYGQEEALALYGKDPRAYLTVVKEFQVDKSGWVCGAQLVKQGSHTDAKTGRTALKPLEGSEYSVKTDLVLVAAGYAGAQDYVAKAFGVELDGRSNVRTEQGQYTTNHPKVFAAGDMHRGQSLVVWAIREGREAASAADTFLMGYSNPV